MKKALLLIDCQYDFADPNGTLFVKGADKDMERLSAWILSNKNELDSISMTIDSHQPMDISHPSFWKDGAGLNPKPFTQITLAEVKSEKWIPACEKDKALNYLEQLEAQGEYPHFIWPEHCISGSRGSSVVKSVMDAVSDWARYHNKTYGVVVKGEYQFSEHFGAFRAQVPTIGVKSTQNNEFLLDFVKNHDIIYIAGEAKSHCVASTIKQTIELLPEHVKKFVVLEDCMSDVENLGHLGEPTYKKAIELGAKFEKAEITETAEL